MLEATKLPTHSLNHAIWIENSGLNDSLILYTENDLFDKIDNSVIIWKYIGMHVVIYWIILVNIMLIENN